MELCVERVGQGPRRLLFAHGWISTRRMWYDVVERLDVSQYTSYLMDFRGCGLSDRPMEGHDLKGYASDMHAVLNDIGAPVTVVGHSMGAKIAQYVAADRPRNLERLILVAPGTAKGVRLNEKHRALSLEAFGSRKRIREFQRAAMVGQVTPEVLERLVDDALTGQREAWFGWYDHGRSTDFSERLSRIDVPAIAVAGARDPLAPPSRVKADVAEAIEGCLFSMLRNAGHNLPVETPAEIAGVIERF
ncbi:MAG: alpha/beta hydrolase [Candidatus Eremiobacteraeota bacterium]|nr:alpha/beta hydrolase [Candidatus Eremiobacteraeota bacterium]